MYRTGRLVGILLLFALVAAMAAGCSQAAQTPPAGDSSSGSPGSDAPTSETPPSTQQPAKPVRLRVGYAAAPNYPQIANYRWEEEMAAQFGYEVEHFFFADAQVAYKSLIAKAVDVVVAPLLPAIQFAAKSDTRLKVVAADLQAPDYVLVAQPEVSSLQDLEGLKLGISTPGDMSDTLSRAVLKRNNIDINKVQIVKVGGTGARIAALRAGQIDAGMAHADAGLAATADGLKILFALGKSTQGYLQHGMVFRQEVLDQEPDLVQTMVNSFVDNVRWAAANREEYIEYSRKWVPDLEDSIREQAYDIFADINMFAVNGGLSEENLTFTLDLELESGTLEQPVPVSEWVDTRFLDKYLEENGRL